MLHYFELEEKVDLMWMGGDLPLTLLARAMFFKRWNSFFATRSFFADDRLAN